MEVVVRDYVRGGKAGGEPWFALEGFEKLRVVGDGLIDTLDGHDTV